MAQESKNSELKFKDVDIERSGAQIILPVGMSLEEGITWMKRKQVEEEREVSLYEMIDAFPLDGAIALWKAISRKYGFAGLVPTPGFWGPTPPSMIGVDVGYSKTMQVPWGSMQIPNIAGRLETQVDQKDGRHVFVLAGQIKQKHKEEVAELARLAREIVKKESIYKGQAIKASFPQLNPRDFDPTSHSPKFEWDTGETKVADLIFPEVVNSRIKSSLFVPIEKSEMCRKAGVPLKSGILLYGPYGTGKTLTARITAKKAVDNGWTFIYLDSVKNLQRAVFFAKQYQPAVVFAEDIDQVLKGGRTEEVNAILNTMDGIDTKGNEVIVVLTTNHVENITPAMLRPGRIDDAVEIPPPNSEAVQKLLRHYGRGLIPDSEKLDSAGAVLEGSIASVIREVVEKSKLTAISRLTTGEGFTLTEQDLVDAAEGMLAHRKLINPSFKEPMHPLEAFGRALGTAIGESALAARVGLTEKDVKSLPPEIVEEATRALANGNGAGPRKG